MKQTLGLDVLRCQTLPGVLKEGVGRELVDLRRVKRPSSPKTAGTVFVVLDFKGEGAQR